MLLGLLFQVAVELQVHCNHSQLLHRKHFRFRPAVKEFSTYSTPTHQFVMTETDTLMKRLCKIDKALNESRREKMQVFFLEITFFQHLFAQLTAFPTNIHPLRLLRTHIQTKYSDSFRYSTKSLVKRYQMQLTLVAFLRDKVCLV